MDLFWSQTGWEQNDLHFRKMAAMPFRRAWPFIPDKPGMYIIRGPRQVGKTCWLKSILAAHLHPTMPGSAVGGKSPNDCFYLSCEEIDDYRDLSQLLKSLKGRSLIILDEINFVKEWDRAIKHFIDGGYGGILCISGSHAYDIAMGVDLMPGRFGEGGGEFHLLPMDFGEFELARREAGWASNDRVAELRQYFRTGGFPIAVADAGKDGSPSASVRETYLRWLKGDVKKLGKDPEKLTEVLIQLAVTLQNPLSFQTLAKKTSIGSPNTVIDYVRVLEGSFALRTLYAIDLNSGAYRHRSDKKFYFTDPLIYWLACDLAGDAIRDVPDEALAELVAHEHLARRIPRFGYLRTTDGEVDFVAAHRWAIEVKWTAIVTGLSKTFHKLAVPEKIVWSQQNLLSDWPHNAAERNPLYTWRQGPFS